MKIHEVMVNNAKKNQLLFWRRLNRVIEIACFYSKLQLAPNTCERKQAKRHECLPRDVSRHSIYPRYIGPTDNARQTN